MLDNGVFGRGDKFVRSLTGGCLEIGSTGSGARGYFSAAVDWTV